MGIANRFKISNILTPKSADEAQKLLDQIRFKTQSLQSEKKALDEEIQKAKDSHASLLASLTQEIDHMVYMLHSYAEPRKEVLTQKKKSVESLSGTYGWRKTPGRVESENSDQYVVEYLKKNGLKKYVRTIEEVDRDQLLKDRPKVACVKYIAQDEFYVKPKVKGWRTVFTRAIDKIIA